MHPDHVPAAWQSAARASLAQFRVCQAHLYDGWTYLSPPAVLEPGNRTGFYRRGTTTLLTDDNGDSRITTPDLATAVLDEHELPSAERHFTVASVTASRYDRWCPSGYRTVSQACGKYRALRS